MNGVTHVVDDDPALLDSVAFLLSTAGLATRTYAGARELLKRAAHLEPGCILTDVRMPEISGLELVAELKRAGAPHPVIVLTGHADVAMAVAAMKAGVADFLEKPVDDAQLLRAVRAALARNDDAASKARERAELEQRAAGLTAREREVFEAVARGDSNKSAALKLGISPRTVEIYRANVMSKLGAQTLSDVVRMALMLERKI